MRGSLSYDIIIRSHRKTIEWVFLSALFQSVPPRKIVLLLDVMYDISLFLKGLAVSKGIELVIFHKKGYSCARDTEYLISQCESPFLCFFDDDVIYDVRWSEILLQNIGDKSLAVGGAYQIEENGVLVDLFSSYKDVIDWVPFHLAMYNREKVFTEGLRRLLYDADNCPEQECIRLFLERRGETEFPLIKGAKSFVIKEEAYKSSVWIKIASGVSNAAILEYLYSKYPSVYQEVIESLHRVREYLDEE
jgi:hypothetical protein